MGELKGLARRVINKQNERSFMQNKLADIKVYVSTDLDKFTFIDGNREVKMDGKFKWLEHCVKTSNFLEVMPIVVNKKFQVTDGQRRLTVARLLKRPIYYIVSELITKHNLMDANIGGDNWSVHDYIHYYAIKGKEDYQLLQMFLAKYGVAPQTALMFANFAADSGGRQNAALKSGDFKYTDYKKSEKAIEKIFEFREFVDFYKKRHFIQAMINIMKNKHYSHPRMLQKFRRYGSKMVNCADTETFTKHIEDFYNRGLKLENKVRFWGRS